MIASRLIRNKSLNMAKQNTMYLSTSVESSVQLEEVGKCGILTLNRPKALNALNLEMVKKLTVPLRQWQDTKSLVIVKGAGTKAFCAGGDVRSLVEQPPSYGEEFFRTEYSLNYLIGTYKIPYVALIDGITMGGGVGISVHGKYRVATEKTMFAMPETSIGLFPDVGGSHFLPRLDGKLGMYLGLTGFRLKGKDVLKAGIASHYCESSQLPELEKALVECSSPSDVELTLNKFCPVDNSEFVLANTMKQINTCFAGNSIEDIYKNLAKDGSDWAQKTIASLHKASPTSLKVSHQQIERGAKLNLAECLQMEFRLGVRHLKDSDFTEGVRALLIAKDNNPQWKPTRLEDVTEERLQSFFEKLSNIEELKL